jgi:hypothetical protein
MLPAFHGCPERNGRLQRFGVRVFGFAETGMTI